VRVRAAAGIARAVVPTWVRRPSTPRRLVLALTRRCNLRCGTCRTHEMEPGEELTPAEIAHLLAAMPGLAWLDLTGGEPFVRPDIEAVFDAVLDSTPALAVLHFPTNGWFGDRVVACAEQVRRRRPGVDLVVTVSVDGPAPLHDRMRGRPGSFERAVQTYRRLDAMRGVETFIGTTVGPDNRDALDQTRDALRWEIGTFSDRRWHWNLGQHSPHFFGNEPVAGEPGDEALVREQLRRRWPPRSLVDLMETGFLVHKHVTLRGGDVSIPCHALHGGAFVAADGTLYPCHVYDRPLADLRALEFDVAAAWRSSEVLGARDDVLRLACGGCFTPCEAYPTLAGSPVRSSLLTAARLARLALGGVR
jgi:Fe-coproporphyrin III synthase